MRCLRDVDLVGITLSLVGSVSGEMCRADKDGARGWASLRHIALWAFMTRVAKCRKRITGRLNRDRPNHSKLEIYLPSPSSKRVYACISPKGFPITATLS
ncbi:hypothetical protein E3Z29_16845 [Pseudomonas sp. S150]|nr:hypothetical protein E3Z29_16845 [Pseudomonas sp. S150]